MNDTKRCRNCRCWFATEAAFGCAQFELETG